jgi:pimeloyl-ACP methyl ester carboxylesterase
MRERVLLLHGLWMRASLMWPLARRLHAAGYAVERIDYASVLQGPEPCIARLAARLADEGEAPLHLVGHSLGGVVALRALDAATRAPPGRVVCLGSPLAGSATARTVAGRRAVLLGRAAPMLACGVEGLPAGHEVGVIAGTAPLGLGRLFHHFDEPNDGSVALSETRMPGLADHLALASSHSGMVFSAPVARQVVAFLRDGRFDHGFSARR